MSGGCGGVQGMRRGAAEGRGQYTLQEVRRIKSWEVNNQVFDRV